MHTHRINEHVTVLNDQLEVPGIGFLPVNAFVLHAREPVVVDTGLGLPDRDFVQTITTFIGAGIMSTERPLPIDRLYLLNPGQKLDVGDRTLHAFRPPLFDNPATVGFYDDRSCACFSSDCFGAPLATVELAGAGDVGEIPAAELLAGQLLWAAIDSPWVHNVDASRYLETVRAMQALDPDVILSTHLPPAQRLSGARLFDMLARAPGANPFVGPDQRALQAMLAGFEPVAAAI
jgi:hypothetical protein